MEYPKRTGNRLTNYNYEQDGAYFITVCVKDRRRILCDIVGTSVPDCPKIQLYKYGEIADRYINQMNNFYNEISVDSYIIMPDHIHFILCIKNGQSGRLVPTGYDNKNSTVARFVGTFKRFCNKEYGENIWQSRYYDHVIRNEQDYIETVRYIENNPLKWMLQNKTQGE